MTGAARPPTRRPPGPAVVAWSGPKLLLVLRLPCFVAVTTCLGIGAHLVAHGTLPEFQRVLFVAFAVLVLWSGLQRHEQSGPRLLSAVMLTQCGMHVAFAGSAPGSGHEHDVAASAVSGLGMLVAHGVAAALCAWWLRRGEAATWRAVRRVLPLLPAVPPGRPLPGRRPTLVAPAARRLRSRIECWGATRRRGPPDILPA